MVKPGGTGRPRLAISARLAPLPPSRSRKSALPSALPSPNVNTHLPDFAAAVAALPAIAELAGLAGPFATLFLSALRAVASGAAFARTAWVGFDFTAVFLSFDAALAMGHKLSARGGEDARLHHVWPAARKPQAFGRRATYAAI